MLTDHDAIVRTLRASGSVFAEDEARLLIEAADGDQQRLDRLVRQRVDGLPLEHLVGWAEFAGLRIRLDPGVFVPRLRSELLVQQAVSLLRDRSEARLAELCCGSGAISAAILAQVPHADLWAADIDPAEVHCARRNLPPERVFEGDLYAALPPGLRGAIDVLIANAPYVPTGAIDLMPAEARLHEPRIALDGGRDGLDVLRRVIAGAPDWLAPGGTVIVQGSTGQAPVLASVMERHGLRPAVVIDEELDDATAVLGTH